MKARFAALVMVTLSLGACVTVPPPPHCSDTGEGLHAVNPEMLTQAQIDAVLAIKPGNYEPQRGRSGRNNGNDNHGGVE